MRLALILLVLLPGALRAGEETPETPESPPLPEALRPGAAAVFDQSPRDKRLGGTTTYRVEAGEEKGHIVIVRDFSTGDVGAFTRRDRLRAVLEVESRRFLSFTYETAGSLTGPLRLAAKLGPDPGKAGRFRHERFRYAAKGDPKITRSRPKLAGFWVPDLLEPFVLGLLLPGGEPPYRSTLIGVESGRVSTTAAEYTPLGEGELSLGGEDRPCRIFAWKRGKKRATVYYRTEDLMPLKHSAAGIVLRPPEDAAKDEKAVPR